MSRNKQPLDPESNLKLDFAEETYNIKTEYEEDVVDHLKGEQELDHTLPAKAVKSGWELRGGIWQRTLTEQEEDCEDEELKLRLRTRDK